MQAMVKWKNSPTTKPRGVARWAAGFAAAWAIGCVLSYANCGDEYGLFVLSSLLGLPGGLLASWLGASGVLGMLYGMLPFGAAVMAGLGAVLARCGFGARWWILAGVVIAIGVTGSLLFQYPDLDSARSKNGSVFAYIVTGAMVAYSLTTLVAAAVAASRAAAR